MTTEMKNHMQYPLSEKIGDPDLFVGREKELNVPLLRCAS
jgi:hypothetical protein